MNSVQPQHRDILRRIARRAMLERGLLPDFSSDVIAELDRLNEPAQPGTDITRDLTDLLWSSIDNDDSRDLDQLTAAESLGGGAVRIYVAIADVDSLVRDGSAIDAHARHNTTSVYTAAEIFPMLPEKLSTGLTSLNPNEDRAAIVAEMVVAADGSLAETEVYRAVVHNRAKLAYNAVAAWLEGAADVPDPVRDTPGLEDNLRLQDAAAQRMRNLRHAHGALNLETIKAKPVFDDGSITGLEPEVQNRAHRLIEDFMIAANGVIARYLSDAGYPSIRRVVRSPKRWERIVELAIRYGRRLPDRPDSRALEQFLTAQRAADPLRFPDLSLTVIKLMGAGEYVAELPGENAPGHFGLAVKDYAHSTAPNRRYPDLITQRLLKAALTGARWPYAGDELDDLARHCTEAEDAADKVERQVGKSAAALLLESRIGDRFDALITGASPKGTWARLVDMPVEGMLVKGGRGVDVGDRVRVELLEVDVEHGFIDFGRVG